MTTATTTRNIRTSAYTSMPVTFTLAINGLTADAKYGDKIWYAVCRGYNTTDAYGNAFAEYDNDYGDGTYDADEAVAMALDTLMDDANAVQIVTMRDGTDDALHTYTATYDDVHCDCTAVDYVFVRTADIGYRDIFAPGTVETVILGDGYTFGDYLSDHNAVYTQDDADHDIYYIDSDDNGNADSEYAFVIYDTRKPTPHDIQWSNKN